MNDQDKTLEFVKSLLADRLRRLERSVDWYRRRHYVAQLSTVVLSATTAVVTGLRTEAFSADTASNIVLILSSTAAVVSAWGAFFAPRDSWHLCAKTYSRFRALQARIEFIEASQGVRTNEDIATEAFESYQSILDDYNAEWLVLRKKSEQP